MNSMGLFMLPRLSILRFLPAFLLVAGLGMPGMALADVEAGVRAFQKGDYQAAIDEWRVDAAQGNANALFNLGQAYRLGKGVAPDLAQAETYYQRAARAGHPAAMGNLANLYYFSKTPPRADDALYWWQMGAEAGDPRSQYILGAMTFNGNPVQKDVPKAYAWTWLAAQAGLEEARTALATMRPYVDAEARKSAEAMAQDMMTISGKEYWLAQLPPDAVTSTAEPEQPVDPSPAAAPPDDAPAVMVEKPAGPVYRINLASMGSRADAETARNTVMTAHGEMIAALPLRIVETEREGRSLYRLQAGRFDSAGAAQAECEHMKSAGLDCFVLRTGD